MAAEGTDLILVARRRDRLDELALALNGVTVEVIDADLSTSEGVAAIVSRLGEVAAPVDLLVNNAGFGLHGPLWERSADEAEAQIAVNVMALVTLSHAACESMVNAGAGTILNISSVAGNQAAPNHAVYGATKAFVTNFTEAVSVELRGTGVSITAACPGLTRTEFHDVAQMAVVDPRPSALWMDARSVARDSLAAAYRGRVVRVNGLLNRAVAFGSRLAPRVVTRNVAGRVTARMADSH